MKKILRYHIVSLDTQRIWIPGLTEDGIVVEPRNQVLSVGYDQSSNTYYMDCLIDTDIELSSVTVSFESSKFNNEVSDNSTLHNYLGHITTANDMIHVFVSNYGRQ